MIVNPHAYAKALALKKAVKRRARKPNQPEPFGGCGVCPM